MQARWYESATECGMRGEQWTENGELGRRLKCVLWNEQISSTTPHPLYDAPRSGELSRLSLPSRIMHRWHQERSAELDPICPPMP